MLSIALVAGGALEQLPRDFDQYVGIDRGSLQILKQGLDLSLAIGDFDSVTPAEKEQIFDQAGEVLPASRHKNDTDTELAVKTVFQRYPSAQLTVFGAFGGRLDHLLANVFLPSDGEIAPFMRALTLLDEQNHVSFYPAGQHLVYPQKGMTYVAFMTSDKTQLNIKGAKYQLTAENFFDKKIYTSNEFTDKPIDVTVPTGYLIVIQSKDK